MDKNARSFKVEKHFQAPGSRTKSKKMVPASMYRVVSLVDGRMLVKDFVEENAETAAGLYINALFFGRIIMDPDQVTFLDGDDYCVAGLRDGHPAARFRVELVRV